MPRKTKKQTRRGNNEGSIYQRADGWWVGQVLYGYKPDGKPNRKAVLGKTREEVADFFRLKVNDLYTRHILPIVQAKEAKYFKYNKV